MTTTFTLPTPYSNDILKFVTKNDQDIDLSGEGRILAEYLKDKNVVADIIESFNNFVDYGINSVLVSIPVIFYTIDKNLNRVPYRQYVVRLSNAALPISGDNGDPLTPEIAHLEGTTMSTELFYTIKEYSWSNNNWIETEESIVFNEKHAGRPFSMGKIPAMVRSKFCNTGGKTNRQLYEMGECPSWPGGYFVTNGEMRSIIIKQKLRNNRFLIYKDKKSDPLAKGIMICNLPSGTTKIGVFRMNYNSPICVWLKFMGYKESGGTPRELNMFFVLELLVKYVKNSDNLDIAINDILQYTNNEVSGQIAAILEYTRILYMIEGNTPNDRLISFRTAIGINDDIDIESYFIRSIKEGLFPQFDTIKDIIADNDDGVLLSYKYDQLCYMIAKYGEYLVGFRREDDRNSVASNKFDTPGIALMSLFSDVWRGNVNAFINTAKIPQLSIDYVQNNLMSNAARDIENTFDSSIRTNKWGYMTSRNKSKTQMVDTLKLSTITLLYSELSKIVVPTSKEGDQFDVRENHQSQTGYIDFVDSPESDACGLTKRKAITCYISQERSDRNLIESVINNIDTNYPDGQYLIINGKLLGSCNSDDTIEFIRNLKFNGKIPFDTMIVYDEKKNEINVSTDGGRCTRPLLRVNSATGLPILCEQNLYGQPFPILLKNKAAEYIDAYEQEFLLVASSIDVLIKNKYSKNPRNYTHVELDPNSQFSFASAEIPLANHNLGTKNCYSCNMMKQGIGTTGSNYFNRFDTGAKMLDYPTEPLMESQMNIISGLNQLPSGRNVMVLYMAYSGDNQEDAIIFNEGSVRRGIFNYTVYYKYKFVATTSETAVKLSEEDITDEKYKNIDPNTGIIREGSIVDYGDVLIRVKHTEQKEDILEHNNADITVKYGEKGVVTRVSASGKVIKIKIENKRNINERQDIGIYYDFIGDKFSSRAATKGVIAKLVPEEDMPVSDTGLVPDVIINPLGVPTRAPINLLKEIQICLGLSLRGRRVNGTTFNRVTNSEFESSNILNQYGYNIYGEHRMLNRKTGIPFEGTFFMGLCDYMMLDHHAIDKFQGQGKDVRREMATGQYVKGRKKEGALRFGEMERDALLGHGISELMHSVMCKSSDEFTCIVCNDCNSMTGLAPTDPTNKRCVKCQGNNVYVSTIGHNFRYFSHLLNSINIRPELELQINE